MKETRESWTLKTQAIIDTQNKNTDLVPNLP